MNSSKLVWLVTGANSGLGLCIAQYALSQSHIVIATARNISRFPQELKNQKNADLIELEIAGPSLGIESAVDAVVERHGRIDVLVNNAGFGLMGALEENTESDIRYQFDVNFFGLLNVTRAVLPHMKRQGSGCILQMSTIGAFAAFEGSSLYVASKNAVEGFTENFALEVKRFGIRVHLVEPGFLRTNFVRPVMEGNNFGIRKDGYMDMQGFMTSINGKQPGDPEKCAERIFELVTETGLAAGIYGELRFVLGSDCLGSIDMKIKALGDTAEKMQNIAPSIDFPQGQ